jgi:hypothetical protein
VESYSSGAEDDGCVGEPSGRDGVLMKSLMRALWRARCRAQSDALRLAV